MKALAAPTASNAGKREEKQRCCGDFTPPLLYGQVRLSHLAITTAERYGSYLSH
jgi:hypothetical protein